MCSQIVNFCDFENCFSGLKEVNGLPHFLLGQSMGGAVALKVHLKQPAEWDGVLLVAPMCKVIPNA